MENIISEKIVKRTKSRSGKTTFSKRPIGFLVAGRVDDKVCLGFSLCHKNDQYDWVDGIHRPGHGRKMATTRAARWRNQETVKVPPSLLKQAEKFASRCKVYYKGLKCPEIVSMEDEDFENSPALTCVQPHIAIETTAFQRVEEE